jgi:hypothetical protein
MMKKIKKKNNNILVVTAHKGVTSLFNWGGTTIRLEAVEAFMVERVIK